MLASIVFWCWRAASESATTVHSVRSPKLQHGVGSIFTEAAQATYWNSHHAGTQRRDIKHRAQIGGMCRLSPSRCKAALCVRFHLTQHKSVQIERFLQREIVCMFA